MPPGDAALIKKIRVRHGSVVECLEIFNEDQSGGAHGNPKGANCPNWSSTRTSTWRRSRAAL
jgi:hypothetical protein